MSDRNLTDIEIGSSSVVLALRNKADMKKRIMSIGLVEDTSVCPLYESTSGGLKAYEFRGSVFAIRDEDAKHIIVRA